MTDKELWAAFCAERGIQDGKYVAWSFGGGAPDKLAELVMAGEKVATASAYELYAPEDDDEPMPQVGDYSVILKADETACCIIQTTKLTVVPFDEVTAQHAAKEGEGDKSLRYWREVHRHFLTRELAEYGLVFTEKTPVLCEEFQLVYCAK